MATEMKTYQKTIIVKAKLFEKGDEDGFVTRYTDDKEREDGLMSTFGMPSEEMPVTVKVPYMVTSLRPKMLSMGFGREYLCQGIGGEHHRWFEEKEAFESTWKEVK